MNHRIKISFRSLSKKPIYSLITFVGFTLSIAAGLIIYLWIYNEKSFDKFHPDFQRIYRVLTLSKEGDKVVKSPMCYRPVARTLKMDYPQIEFATYISYDSEDSPLHLETSNEKIEARGCYTNEDFFKIFSGFRFIEGSSEKAFNMPGNIVLSDVTAKRIFGNQPALGKIIITDKYSRDVFTVSGVIQIPEQSHINFGYILSENNKRNSVISNNWGDKGWVRVYIELQKDASIDKQFLDQISNQISRYSSITDKLLFQPLADIHLRSDYSDNWTDNKPGSLKYVWIFSCIAFLIIVMASLNYSALAIARASERSLEIGIRKINGGNRFSIFIQYLLESLIQISISSITAFLVALIFLPFFNGLSSERLTFNISSHLAANLFFLILLLGIIAGIYPAAYLSSFNPVVIFRRGSVTGSKRNFIKSLVIVQFTIALFFIMSAILFIKQSNYIHNIDLGLDDKNVIIIPTGLWYDNKDFKEELLRNPRIISVSASTYAPIDVGFKRGLSLSHQGSFDTLEVNYFFVDEDFAKTYKLNVIKGQFLQMTSDSYWKELEKRSNSKTIKNEEALSIPIVINETAEKLLGFDNTIGQRIGDNVIVGVVKDFHFRSLHHVIEPLVMSNNPEVITTLNVRILPEDKSETINYIKDIYKKHRENREFSYTFFDDLLEQTYLPETRLKNITIFFAVLAVIISILGILGMSVFLTYSKTKEIGIRRVAGARGYEILILLNKDFLKWLIMAFIIATPLAWYSMHLWLQNFIYKTDLSWWIFLIAATLVFGIALCIVNLHSWKAAMKNPVEAIRDE
jgi:putative ABC transport system permease protein